MKEDQLFWKGVVMRQFISKEKRKENLLILGLITGLVAIVGLITWFYYYD